MQATPDIANHHAKLLNFLVDELHTNPMDMHIIGHSLGAHIAGFAGRKVKEGSVGRITGSYKINSGLYLGRKSEITILYLIFHFLSIFTHQLTKYDFKIKN